MGIEICKYLTSQEIKYRAITIQNSDGELDNLFLPFLESSNNKILENLTSQVYQINLYDQNSIDNVLKGITKLFLLLPINPLFSIHPVPTSSYIPYSTPASPSSPFPYSLLLNRIKSSNDIEHIISFHLLLSTPHSPSATPSSAASSHDNDSSQGLFHSFFLHILKWMGNELSCCILLWNFNL